MGKPTLPLMSKYYVIPAEAGIQRGRGEGRANHTPLSLSDGELKGVSTAPVIPTKAPVIPAEAGIQRGWGDRRPQASPQLSNMKPHSNQTPVPDR